MPILNYSTTVPPDRTVLQIHSILRKAGAAQVMTNYDDARVPVGVTFLIDTKRGKRAFTLPVNTERVFQVLQKDPTIRTSFKNKEQAERVAWRVAKDWLEAQMALIATEMVSLEEVMLPYMRSVDGRTVWELYRQGEMPMIGSGDDE